MPESARARAGGQGRQHVRVAVLPREVAARIITSSLARAAGVVNALSLSLDIPLLIEFMTARGLVQRPPIPFLILVALVLLAIAVAVRPKPIVVAAFLVFGSIGAVAFQVVLIGIYPAFLEEGLHILNRPAVALVLVGVTATTVRAGLLWTIGGFWLSTLVTLAVSRIADVPFTPGYGPLFMVVLFLVAYGSLAAIQESLRRRVPNFEVLEEETRRLGVEENLRLRVTAAVHDTLLNDLSLVMNAPDELDTRMTDRLRADVETLTSAEWLSESAEVAVDEQDAALRNEIMMLLSDLQWRGLTVQVTGSGAGIYRLDGDVAALVVDVIRACLENVLRHSGAEVAEVDLSYSPDGVTVMITDQGSGFDPGDVPADRLGLRTSVVERVRSVGGTAKIWSSPGEGTSIVIHLPVAEIVTEHEGSPHAKQ
jgi:signal transduction histidine kinase